MPRQLRFDDVCCAQTSRLKKKETRTIIHIFFYHIVSSERQTMPKSKSSGMPELDSRQISALLGPIDANATRIMRRRTRSLTQSEADGDEDDYFLASSRHDVTMRKRLCQAVADLKGFLLHDVVRTIEEYQPNAVRPVGTQWSFDVRMLSDETIDQVNHVLRTRAPNSGYSSILASKNIETLSAVAIGASGISSSSKKKRKASAQSNSKANKRSKSSMQKRDGDYTYEIDGIKVSVVASKGNEKRKVICSVCSKSFRTKGEVRAHIRTHTGEKPLKCKFCDKRFAHPSNRRVHERTHLKVKPFKCTECGKGFSHKATLKEHMSIHTGTFPFSCEFCGKGFRSRSNMSKHKKRLHANGAKSKK